MNTLEGDHAPLPGTDLDRSERYRGTLFKFSSAAPESASVSSPSP